MRGVVRRFLLMILTVLGITLLVFALMAAGPGGVAAALRPGPGEGESAERAAREAYLEGRYGLDRPTAEQYVRWLGRLSPVKFGRPPRIGPAGERLEAPRAPSPPVLLEWAGVAAAPAPSSDNVGSDWRAAADRAARALAGYFAARAEYEAVLRRYARSAGEVGAIDASGRVVPERLRRRPMDPSNAETPAVVEAARRAAAAHGAARSGCEAYGRALKTSALPSAGFVIVPGAVYLDRPDLGMSFSRGRPVADLIAEALPITVLLNLLAFALVYAIGIPAGILAAARGGTWIDAALRAVFIGLWSLPIVWSAVMLQGFLAHAGRLAWFPPTGLHSPGADEWPMLPFTDESGAWRAGFLGDALWHLCLPVACLAMGSFAVLSRQTRAAVLENLHADYARTARAKGASERAILFRHVLRNSLLPIITLFAGVFPAMLSGSVVVESVFNIPGMGTLIFDAVMLRDREVLMASVLMVSVVNVLALWLADVLYALADPRVSVA